jgi:Flp pilus assembly pilin Flp
MWTILSALAANDLGVTAIEYAMIGSLIGIIAVAAKASIGATLAGIFNSVSSGL